MPSPYPFLLALLSAFFLALLGGCATREKLALAEKPEQIVLATSVSYKVKAFSGNQWEYIALPGIYGAERKDNDGVYFYGSGRSIVEIGDLYGNVPRLKVGGIYVPNDKSRPVEMVFAFENTPTTTNDLNQYMQDRYVTTTALPELRRGVSDNANFAGHVVASTLVAVMLQAGEGEITRVIVKDQAASDLIRTARGPKQAKTEVEAKLPNT
jgi:hypothetical protein